MQEPNSWQPDLHWELVVADLLFVIACKFRRQILHEILKLFFRKLLAPPTRAILRARLAKVCIRKKGNSYRRWWYLLKVGTVSQFCQFTIFLTNHHKFPRLAIVGAWSQGCDFDSRTHIFWINWFIREMLGRMTFLFNSRNFIIDFLF